MKTEYLLLESFESSYALKRFFRENNGQTSVEVILLIGAVLVLTIISGTYVYRINSSINIQFNETMTKSRDFMLGNI
ncbi:MAG: class III signal peptide-containing protein [Methanobrevibacter sp.]|nr:class III signal peptide-containing protein [Methanobrevibacter sp.]